MSTTYKFPLSASLARRLAEAADGFRNVNQVFFIAGYKPPHPIKDFPDFDKAKAYFVKNGFADKDYAIFGPYKTIDDVNKLKLAGAEDITKVELTIHYKNGDPQKVTLPGAIDSIFLNLSSFEKFVFPYYCHLFGVEYAKTLRENLIEQYSDVSQKGTGKACPPPYPHRVLTYMHNLYKEQGEPGEEIT